MLNQSKITTTFSEVIDRFKQDLLGLKTGRAHPALVENIPVEIYGSTLPIKQLGSVNTPEPRSIVIEPWDKNSAGAIEKALRASDLGLNPANEGTRVRINLPELTAERRAELIKVVGDKAETARINLRQAREGFQKELKESEGVSEDEIERDKKTLQDAVDEYNQKIVKISADKEKELEEN